MRARHPGISPRSPRGAGGKVGAGGVGGGARAGVPGCRSVLRHRRGPARRAARPAVAGRGAALSAAAGRQGARAAQAGHAVVNAWLDAARPDDAGPDDAGPDDAGPDAARLDTARPHDAGGVRLREMNQADIASIMALEHELFPEDAWTPEMF